MAKIVQCPECGNEFKKPFLEEKRSGLGFTFPGLGSVKCPKCGHRAPSREFSVPEERDSLPK